MSDPFECLGLPPCFDLAPALLAARHLELSRALHPDRYVGRPAAERRLALSRAIEVNEAARQLKDPVRRAEILLAQRGHESREGEEPRLGADFLMAILELREELGSARQKRDLHSVRELAERMRAREAAVLSTVSRAFEGLSADPPARASEQAQGLRMLLGELRYYQRFLEEARAIEDELE